MFPESKLTSFSLDLAEAADPLAAAAWLEQHGIDVVHVGVFDSSGTLRQKRFPAQSAAGVLTADWSFIDAIQYWDPADATFAGAAAVHETVRLDLGSGRRFPFESSAAVFVGDFTGPSAERSPRALLGRMIERAMRLGLEPWAGWEYELIVLDQSHQALADTAFAELRPAMTANRCWSALTAAIEAQTMAGWMETLAAGDVLVHHICSELGPGCLELALGHRPAQRSADDAAMAKLFTKAYFARRGQTATFMAQLAESFPGLGGHPSLSFRRLRDGSPALAGTERYGLSAVALHAIAGIVRLLPELLVMAAPTVNSYRRYAPGNWAPHNPGWGVGNYTCGLRVVADHPEGTRLELRVPGADSSPHLCLAMMLGAAVWGIQHELLPPAPVLATDSARDLIDPQIGTLPRSLSEAADRFGASEVAEELFGRAFIDHLTASRLAEEAACQRFVSPQERARYLHQV